VTETKNDSNPVHGFIKEAAGPVGLFAVFEDDGETGYLYLYEPEGRGVFRHLRIYTSGPSLAVSEGDVDVEWTNDFRKCGVRIWQKMRGIIDLLSNREGRVLLENRNTPGIGDSDWLDGFTND